MFEYLSIKLSSDTVRPRPANQMRGLKETIRGHLGFRGLTVLSHFYDQSIFRIKFIEK